MAVDQNQNQPGNKFPLTLKELPRWKIDKTLLYLTKVAAHPLIKPQHTITGESQLGMRAIQSQQTKSDNH